MNKSDKGLNDEIEIEVYISKGNCDFIKKIKLRYNAYGD